MNIAYAMRDVRADNNDCGAGVHGYTPLARSARVVVNHLLIG